MTSDEITCEEIEKLRHLKVKWIMEDPPNTEARDAWLSYMIERSEKLYRAALRDVQSRESTKEEVQPCCGVPKWTGHDARCPKHEGLPS